MSETAPSHKCFFAPGSNTAPASYTTGDRSCDTPPNATSHKGCTASTSCAGVPVPTQNYMELTDDACMTGFSAEQVQRMRCTLAAFRSTLAQ